MKKMLGIDVDDDSFDTDIIVHINTMIPALSQMGIGPRNGFIVTSADEEWSDYINSDVINLEGVKSYLYLRIKLIFDPPTNSTTVEAFNNSIRELEWRMTLAVETNNLEG